MTGDKSFQYRMLRDFLKNATPLSLMRAMDDHVIEAYEKDRGHFKAILAAITDNKRFAAGFPNDDGGLDLNDPDIFDRTAGQLDLTARAYNELTVLGVPKKYHAELIGHCRKADLWIDDFIEGGRLIAAGETGDALTGYSKDQIEYIGEAIKGKKTILGTLPLPSKEAPAPEQETTQKKQPVDDGPTGETLSTDMFIDPDNGEVIWRDAVYLMTQDRWKISDNKSFDDPEKTVEVDHAGYEETLYGALQNLARYEAMYAVMEYMQRFRPEDHFMARLESSGYGVNSYGLLYETTSPKKEEAAQDEKPARPATPRAKSSKLSKNYNKSSAGNKRKRRTRKPPAPKP